MIVVRNVFQAKYGKGAELVALFKESNEQWSGRVKFRILTDASGPFFTIVTEEEVGSFAEWEERRATIFDAPEFGAWFARMTELVESGRREFYNIEA